jgi:hypothetical protein
VLTTWLRDALKCPHCGDEIAGATSVKGMDRPSAGAITICMKCAGVSQFTGEPLSLVPFSDLEQLDAKARRFIERSRRLIIANKPS